MNIPDSIDPAPYPVPGPEYPDNNPVWRFLDEEHAQLVNDLARYPEGDMRVLAGRGQVLRDLRVFLFAELEREA